MKRIITTALAATIAFTGFAFAPVQAADRGEIARFLLGAGALAVIANEVSKNNGRNGHVTRHYEKPRHNGHVYKPHTNNRYKPKPARKVVPSSCLRVNNSGHGPNRYFGQHCLKQRMNNTGRLPGGCTKKIWTKDGARYVYAAQCLRNNGWVFG